MSSQLDVRGYTLHIPEPDSNVGWVRLGEVFILFGRGGAAPEERMNQVFEGLSADGVTTAVGASVGAIRLTSTQRKRLSELIKGKKLVTILDHNPIARGIVTALGWFGLKITLLHWNQLDTAIEAIAPVEASPDDLGEVMRVISTVISGDFDRMSAAS